MHIGYIKLHRQFLDWEWYDDINVCRLFLHLLLKANHEEKKWHGKTIGIGQLVTSLENLASQTKLSVKQVRIALNKLKTTNEVASQATNNYSLISIINWKKWQGNGTPEGEPTANEGQAEGNQRATTKEGKKERSKESIYEAIGKNDFQKVYEFGSSIFPKLAVANNYEITKWLESGCDAEKDILPELQRKKGQQIGSWSYFTEPIAQAKANRLKPMPTPKKQNSKRDRIVL